MGGTKTHKPLYEDYGKENENLGRFTEGDGRNRDIAAERKTGCRPFFIISFCLEKMKRALGKQGLLKRK